jgi:hypothetical protein
MRRGSLVFILAAMLCFFPATRLDAQQFTLQPAVPVGDITQGLTNQQGGGWMLTPLNDWVGGPQAQIEFTFTLPTQLNTSLSCVTTDHLTFWCDVHGMVFTHGVFILGNELVDASSAVALTNYQIKVDGFYIEGFSVNGTTPYTMNLTTVNPSPTPPPPVPIAHWIYLTNVVGYKTGFAVENDGETTGNYAIQLIPRGAPASAQTFALGTVAAGDIGTFMLDNFVVGFTGQVNILGPTPSKATALLCNGQWQGCVPVSPQ